MELEVIQPTKTKRAKRTIEKTSRTLGVSTKRNHKEIWLSVIVGAEILRHHPELRFNCYKDSSTNKVYLKFSDCEKRLFRMRRDKKNGGPWLRTSCQEVATFIRDHFNIEEEAFRVELDVNISPDPSESLLYEILKPTPDCHA